MSFKGNPFSEYKIAQYSDISSSSCIAARLNKFLIVSLSTVENMYDNNAILME